MSTFLTPPVWYDKNGNLNKMLTGSVNTGNGIAVGEGASATGNTVQLGNNNEVYNLSVGNGTGTLEIGSIKFEKMSTAGNVVSISSPGVYLCCLTQSSQSSVAIFFIGNLNDTAPGLTSSPGSCAYFPLGAVEAELHEIQAGTGFTIDYCFKIIDTSL